MSDAAGGSQPNNRREHRQRTLKAGRIIVARQSTLDCLIRNLSERGALVEIGVAQALPPKFEFLLVDANTIRDAELRWQRGQRAGIEFMSEARPSVRRY
jgi:hypothetical protein